MTLLAPLVFLIAAVIGLAAIAGTVLRYRDSVLATLAAGRDVSATRDFDFRVFAFGRPVPSVAKLRRSSLRVTVRRAATVDGWRAAA